jgi:hypothetical protein
MVEPLLELELPPPPASLLDPEEPPDAEPLAPPEELPVLDMPWGLDPAPQPSLPRSAHTTPPATSVAATASPGRVEAFAIGHRQG